MYQFNSNCLQQRMTIAILNSDQENIVRYKINKSRINESEQTFFQQQLMSKVNNYGKGGK